MTRFEAALLFICALLIPLTNLRLGGINLTLFDIAVLPLFVFQVLRTGSMPRIGWTYWVAAGLMIAAGAFSGVWARQPIFVLEQVVQYLFIFVVVVPAIFVAARDTRSARIVLLGLTIASILLANSSRTMYAAAIAEGAAGRFGGMIGDPQQLAFSVSSFIAYLIVAPGAFRGRSRLPLLVTVPLYLGLAGVYVWLIMASASRTGMVAGFVAPVLALLLIERRRIQTALFQRTLKFAAIGVALIAGVVIILRMTSPEITAMATERVALTFDTESQLVNARTDVYAEAINSMTLSTLVPGVGLSNYPFVSVYQKRPHNIFLMYLSEGGLTFLIGLIAMFGLFFSKIMFGSERWRRLDPVHRYVAAAAAGGFAAFFIIGMFNTQSISRMYWFNLAYMLGALDSTETQP